MTFDNGLQLLSKAIRPDVIPRAIRLIPHCYGIAAAINCYLGIRGMSCIYLYEGCCAQPACAIHITIRPDVIPRAIMLIPHCYGITGAINCYLGIRGMSIACLYE